MAATTVYRICAALALAGAALFVWGLLTHTYADNAAAYQLLVNDCDRNGVIAPHWHERMDAVRTMRWPLMNSGCAMLLLAGCVATLAAWNVGKSGQWCVTPTKRRYFFLIGLLGLVIAWGGEVFSIMLEIRRHFVPSCADSPGIPLIGITSFFTIATVLGIGAGLILVNWFAPLPTPLLAWNPTRTARSWALSVCFAPVLAILALVLVDGVRFESFLATPGYVLLLYLAEATRSALVRKSKPTKDHSAVPPSLAA